MPLYEFDCEECHQPFDKLVRNSNTIHEVTCPTCGSYKITKKVSSIAARSNGEGAFSYPSATACSPVGT